MTENRDAFFSGLRSVISQLQASISDINTLLALLSAPLANIGLLPPKLQRYNSSPLSDDSVDVFRHFPPIQRAIIDHISSTWEPVLSEMDVLEIIEQYFCPDIIFNGSTVAGQISLVAYATILAQPLTDFSIRMLARMSREYPVNRIFLTTQSTGKQAASWEDCIRNLLAIPGKVANTLGGTESTPDALSHESYMKNFCLGYESLIYSIRASYSQNNLSAIAFGLIKLSNIGLFSSAPPAPHQPSFFHVIFPKLRQRINANDMQYAAIWSKILSSIPSTMATRSVACSLFAVIDADRISELGMDSSYAARAQVKREAQFLHRFFGNLNDSELRDTLSSLAVGRIWSFGFARVIVSYFGGAGLGPVDERSIATFVDTIIEVWSSPVHIKHSLLNKHQYLTVLLLLNISLLPASSDKLQTLALTSSFISCIGTYIGHRDESVRRCGMLVAEVLAQSVGKKLNFGEWEGESPSKVWAHDLRELISARDVDADVSKAELEEILVGFADEGAAMNAGGARVNASSVAEPDAEESDTESLVGYGSSDNSRTPSPSPSELDDIEKDPSLSVKPKPVHRPVYLAQLGTLIRGSGGLKGTDDENEADRIEMAISVGEDLIRRKRLFGSELEENAVDLVHCFVGLNDNYDLKEFQRKRQRILTALVYCCPRKSAPTMIEQFFSNQYSTEQRFAMLNALAFGARELANLPLPPDQKPPSQELFPSRMLPAPLHNRYVQREPIDGLIEGITRMALDKAKDNSTDRLPPKIVRERNLRIRPTAKIQVLNKDRQHAAPNPAQPNTFFQVAAEFFISPLINRFWSFLQDEQMREKLTTDRKTISRYRGAGTGLILSSLVLSGFIATLTVLVHASQNAPEWLAVIGPEALELAVTVGTRPVSRPEDDSETQEKERETGNEASVLSATLELALVVLDACLEIDGGRSLGLDHTSLLFGAEEWATKVFTMLEKGIRVQDLGGVQELKLHRAAAGVLIKVDALKSRWRQSMVDIR